MNACLTQCRRVLLVHERAIARAQAEFVGIENLEAAPEGNERLAERAASDCTLRGDGEGARPDHVGAAKVAVRQTCGPIAHLVRYDESARARWVVEPVF